VRIIAGKWGGRRLQAPVGRDTRPTGDRVRESLFSSLHSRLGTFEGLHVLDAFAGSGALGFEALSRGAAELTAVEYERKSAQIITDNYTRLIGDNSRQQGKDSNFRLMRGDIFRLTSRLQNLQVDIAFFDPPYDMSDEKIRDLLIQLNDVHVFAQEALIVVERAKGARSEQLWSDSFRELARKCVGDTCLYFVSVTQ